RRFRRGSRGPRWPTTASGEPAARSKNLAASGGRGQHRGVVLERIEDGGAPPPATLKAQRPAIVEPARPLDLWLLAAMLGLVAIGTVEVYSSSAVYAFKKTGDAAYFLNRQLIYVGLGLGALWFGAAVDHRWLRRFAYPLLLVSVGLLV